MKASQAELAAARDKNKMVAQAKSQLEKRVEELNTEIDRVSGSLISSTREFDLHSSKVSLHY